MSAVTTNILCGNLVISDIISIFESANGMNSFESSQNIFYTADKAAIPGNDSTQVDSAVCQNTKGIVAYSLLYRLQNLFPMANGKILTANDKDT